MLVRQNGSFCFFGLLAVVGYCRPNEISKTCLNPWALFIDWHHRWILRCHTISQSIENSCGRGRRVRVMKWVRGKEKLRCGKHKQKHSFLSVRCMWLNDSIAIFRVFICQNFEFNVCFIHKIDLFYSPNWKYIKSFDISPYLNFTLIILMLKHNFGHAHLFLVHAWRSNYGIF